MVFCYPKSDMVKMHDVIQDGSRPYCSSSEEEMLDYWGVEIDLGFGQKKWGNWEYMMCVHLVNCTRVHVCFFIYIHIYNNT